MKKQFLGKIVKICKGLKNICRYNIIYLKYKKGDVQND